MTTPTKNTKPVRRSKRNATSNQLKDEGVKSDDWGGIQTNEVDTIADDEQMTDWEESDIGSIDEISIVDSGSDSDGSDSAWLNKGQHTPIHKEKEENKIPDQMDNVLEYTPSPQPSLTVHPNSKLKTQDST